MKIIRLRGKDFTDFMQNRDGVRARMKKMYFDEHGPCRLDRPNGHIMCVVAKDPGLATPSEHQPVQVENDDGSFSEVKPDGEGLDAKVEAQKRMRNSGHLKNVPSPKACNCLKWPWDDRQFDERKKPIEHHPKCAYKRAWERNKGTHMKVVPAGPNLRPQMRHAGTTTNPSVTKPTLSGRPSQGSSLKVKKSETIPHYSRCPKCSSFTKSKRHEQDQHHPTCEYYKKFKAISLARASVGKPPLEAEPVKPTKKNPIMVFDLTTGSVLRRAEPEDIEEAQRRLRDEGSALITIDGLEYLVAFDDGESIEAASPEQAASGKLQGEHENDHADTEPPSASTDVEASGEELAG
jgi:hypothetical protein